MSLYKGEWNGKQAAKYLLEAEGVIQTYYENQVVVKAAEKMKKIPKVMNIK
jgi:hypothetical protein